MKPSKDIELDPLGVHRGPSTTSLPPPYDSSNPAGPSFTSPSSRSSDFPPPPRRDPRARHSPGPVSGPASGTTPGTTSQEPESGTLGQGYRQAEDLARAAVRPGEGQLDAASYFGLVAAGWFTLIALPMLLFPRLVLFFAQPTPRASTATTFKPLATPTPNYDRDHYDALTSLEAFLLHILGLGALSLAALCLFVVVPNYTPRNPARLPAITTLALLGCVAAFASWNAPLGALATVTGVGNAVVGAYAWWALFFGNEQVKYGKYLKKNSRLKRL